MTDLSMTNDDCDLIIDGKLRDESKKYNNGMFFVDGIRRIDFVLVYQRINDSSCNDRKRVTFLKTLIKEGLEIEIQDDKGNLHPIRDRSDGDHEDGSPCHQSNIVFIKIYASWDTLCRYAEIMKIRKPMLNLGVDYDFNRKTFVQKLLEQFDFLKVFNIDESLLGTISRGFTWPFSKSKEYLFDIPEDRSRFFSPAERSLMVNYILRRASYRHISDKNLVNITDIDMLEDIISRKNNVPLETIHDDVESNIESSNLIDGAKGLETDESVVEAAIRESVKISMDFGIAKLISDGVFESAYILHEKPLMEDDNPEKITDNHRNLLYKHWVLMRNIFRLQPLDHIRLYFGEKVAFYFAWLGFYTYWLLPVSLLGVIITIYNFVNVYRGDVIVNEVINGTNITMCPVPCFEGLCKFWKLSEAKGRFFIIRILDNGATVILAIVTSIWASLFLEMWKRQQIKLAYHWNVHDMEYEDEPPRPEFVSLIEKSFPRKQNLISGIDEPYIPFWRRRVPVITFTYSTVLLSVIMALAFLGGIILYKLVILPLLMRSSKNISISLATIITAATGSMISLIIIMTLTIVYSRVAEWLTDLEHHRTQSQYDSSITLKLYLLEFINNYSSIFYIGFIQQYTQTVPTPKSKSYFTPKGCPPGGCLLDLSMQLAFIMVGKQIISHIKEYSIPRLCSWIKKNKLQKSEKKIIFRRNDDMEHELGCDDLPMKDQTDQVVIVDQTSNTDNKSLNIHKVEPELVRCYADNILADPGPRPLFGEYLEMLIQFGFITIFIPAFPLAPLLALCNNLLEIRGDALKFVRALRRPVSQRVKDIGIWISILSIVSQIAVKSNAILIAFSTTYIERLVYKYHASSSGTLKGFVNFSMSYMDSTKFNATSGNSSEYCRFMGYKHSPWSPDNDSYTAEFWQILAFKVIFVYLFENLVSLFMTIISVIIPDVPEKLRISMKREAVLTNEIILKAELLRHKNENASKLVAESFKKSAFISKKLRSKSKPNRLSLASQILMKNADDVK